jgi:hypothetical protein
MKQENNMENLIEMTLDEWTEWVQTIRKNATSEEAANNVISRERDNISILIEEKSENI